MKLGIMELLVIFIVALLVLGPDKLPEYAKKFGVALREFRKATADLSKDIQENVVEPLEEIQRPLTEAVAPINEMTQQIQKDITGITDTVNGKKPAPAAKVQEAPAAAPAPEITQSEIPAAAEVPAEAAVESSN